MGLNVDNQTASEEVLIAVQFVNGDPIDETAPRKRTSAFTGGYAQ